MPRPTLAALIFLASAVAPSSALAQAAAKTPADWSAVEQAIGRKGAMNPGDVIKFGFPRGDMQVTVDGVAVKPALALGSWVAFKHVGKEALAMGDLVLAEDEVGPVMRKLQEGGVEQTALHNHVLRESPRVMYMHIMARGDASKIASTIHDALGLTKTPMTVTAPQAAAAIDLDTAAIAKTLGVAGK